MPAVRLTALGLGFAQAQEPAFVFTLLVPEQQRVYVKCELNIDQRTLFRTSLSCKPSPAVKSVVASTQYSDLQGTRQDPALLTELGQNAALDTSASGFSLNLPDNSLHFYSRRAT